MNDTKSTAPALSVEDYDRAMSYGLPQSKAEREVMRPIVEQVASSTQHPGAESVKRPGGSDKTPNPFALLVLGALNGRARHIYGGTVPEAVKQQRRERNRAARKSRRINRKRGAR
jgi:hypothetical protein